MDSLPKGDANEHLQPVACGMDYHTIQIAACQLKMPVFRIKKPIYSCFAAFWALVRVFFKSIVMVMGPTPPGTGVM